MKQSTYNDLARLAKERCRDGVLSVTQLLDDDPEKAALLVAVAADMIKGATVMLTNDDIDEDEALGNVLYAIFNSIGAKRIHAALDRGSREESR